MGEGIEKEYLYIRNSGGRPNHFRSKVPLFLFVFVYQLFWYCTVTRTGETTDPFECFLSGTGFGSKTCIKTKLGILSNISGESFIVLTNRSPLL